MNTKTLSLLGGITILIILAAIFLGKEPSNSIPESGQPLFPDLMTKINDVSEMLVKTQKDTTTLIQGESSWGVKEKEGYRADFEKIKQSLIGLAELRIVEPKTKNKDLYQKLGLQDPGEKDSHSKLVALKTKDGTSIAELIIGNQRPGKGNPDASEFYVRKSGDPQSWLVKGRLRLETGSGEWLDKQILDIQDHRIRRVHVTHPDGTTLTVRKSKPDDSDFFIVGMPKGTKVKSHFTVNNVAMTLGHLTLEDVKKGEAIDFTKNPGLRAVLETFDGLRVLLTTARHDDAIYGKVKAVFDPALVYQVDKTPSPKKEKEQGKPTKMATTKEAQKAGVAEQKEQETKEQPKPRIKSKKEVQEEVSRINTSLAGWAFVLPKFRVENFSKHRADLLEKKD